MEIAKKHTIHIIILGPLEVIDVLYKGKYSTSVKSEVTVKIPLKELFCCLEVTRSISYTLRHYFLEKCGFMANK